jgi:uncharacterized protein YkwD
MFLIGGGAMEANYTNDAVAASVSHKSTPAVSSDAASTPLVQVLGARRHHRKHHHKKRHHKHHKHASRATGASLYAGTTRRWPGAINTGSAATVNANYWRYYAPGLNVPTGYNADDSRCQLGTNTATSLVATRNAINFVRSMGGLAPVGFNSALNARSQRTALIMSANKRLSHAPSSSWRCYTSDGGANAGRSNLALSYPSITSAGVVGLYMSDPGGSNFAAGHRRWVLNPFATQMGSGSTNTANALTVIGPSSSSRPNPTFVPWPSAGYFPNAIEPGGRWSVSAGNRHVNFAGASVAVYRNGHRISATKAPVENGYAQPTLVFNIPANQAKSGTYTVAVRNIRTGGNRAYNYTYHVSMFTPSH